MRETVLAKELLNGVWEMDTAKVKRAILDGADPNWIFNGYPILLHAVYLEDLDMVNLLIEHGATQISEALGFALDFALGDMVWPLIEKGVLPKNVEVDENLFGHHPNRFIASRTTLQNQAQIMHA